MWPKLNFTVKFKKILKSQNFDDFSTSKYDISRTVYPIRMIFLKTAHNFILFLNEDKKVFKNIKFENVIFDQKKAKLATHQKLGRKSKNYCRIRNQRPKIREVRYIYWGAKIFDDQKNWTKFFFS